MQGFFSSCEHPLLLAFWWTPDLSSGRDAEGHLDLPAFSLLLEPWSAQFPRQVVFCLECQARAEKGWGRARSPSIVDGRVEGSGQSGEKLCLNSTCSFEMT